VTPQVNTNVFNFAGLLSSLFCRIWFVVIRSCGGYVVI